MAGLREQGERLGCQRRRSAGRHIHECASPHRFPLATPAIQIALRRALELHPENYKSCGAVYEAFRPDSVRESGTTAVAMVAMASIAATLHKPARKPPVAVRMRPIQ